MMNRGHAGHALLLVATVAGGVVLAGIVYSIARMPARPAADPLAIEDCRQTNRLLAAHLSRQTSILITRDREIRALRAELARRRSQERSL